jgi:membrane fusion protein, multidrug efflux system
MKKPLIIIAVVCAIIVLLALPKLLSTSKKMDNAGTAPGSSKSTQSKKAPPLTVQAIIVRPERLENSLRVTGTLLAGEETELRSEVSGLLLKLRLREGMVVSKGTLLVKLNDAELEAQLRRVVSQKKLAEDQEFRQQKLLEIKGISQSEYDVVLNELNAIKSEVDLVKAQIARTEIRAPFSGTIGLRYVSEGAYITPTTRIATLTNITMLRLDFAVPGQYASLLKSGDRVDFTLQGTSAKYAAKIFAIEPRIDPLTRTVQVRAMFANGAETRGKVVPGAFAEVVVNLHDIQNALLIPTEALIPEIKGQRVFVSKNSIVTPVDVETGIRTERKLQITSGLQEGDTVITTGLLQIKGGASVNVEVQ